MKLFLASLCFICAYVSHMGEARSESIRVRLMASQERVQISGSALHFQNLSQPYRPVAVPLNSHIEVRLMQKQGKKIWGLRVNDRDPEHLFTEKFLLIQGENLRSGSQSLPQRILLSQNSKLEIDVVGVLSLDDYLVGVLASEMPLSWPLETLKAQAVAARSYALAVVSERKDKPYHLESSVLDQVFRHVLAGDDKDPLIVKALQAVRETKGEELYASNNRVLKAFFHSDCGGKTTTAKNVWSYGVNTGVAVDSSCPTNPRAQWQLSLTKEELARRLRIPEISGVDLIRVPSEKRVQAVRLTVSGAPERVLSANSFRAMLGYQELRSSVFEMKKIGETFLFQGQGFGHGVGLCQWGSRSLGRSGMSYRKILAHYYPLAQLK